MIFRIALHLAFIVVFLTVIISWRYLGPVKRVTLVVDGVASGVETRQMKVSAVLAEAGMKVAPADAVSPPKDASVTSGDRITLTRAMDVTVSADGGLVRFQTTASTVGEALRESDITIRPYDLLTADGHTVSSETALRSLGYDPQGQKQSQEKDGGENSPTQRLRASFNYSHNNYQFPPRPAPVSLSVARAVPLYLKGQGLPMELFSLKETVGESLADAGVKVFPRDLVVPHLGTRVSAGMRIYLYRAKDATIKVDDGERQVRTLAGTVGELLEEQRIILGPLDQVEPSLRSPLQDKMTARVMRVKETEEIVENPINFNVQYYPNYDLELDEQNVIQTGSSGLRKTAYRVRYEDGTEVSRSTLQEWVEIEPKDTIIRYGAKIVLRALETPEGTVQYWRRMRVFATWYDASHGGKPRESPRYGITALGLQATKGVIAVDPRVIPFYSQIYVPGYGPGIAGDTGGAVKGRIIDLAFDEDAPKTWASKWTDIYLLTPVPSPDKIPWVLP